MALRARFWAAALLLSTVSGANAQCANSVCAYTPNALGTLGPMFSASSGINNSSGQSVSDDGSVIVGYSVYTNQNNAIHVTRWINQSIEDLGALGMATATSADGAVIVGVSATSNGDNRAFRWANGIMSDLGTMGGGNSSIAYGTNTDGSVIVGSAVNAQSASRAFRWTSQTGMVDLGTLGGALAQANAVSGDGNIVVGFSTINSTDNTVHAFRWANGLTDLGTLGGTNSQATGISRDGSTIIGWAESSNGNNRHAFRYVAGGINDLGTLPGGFTSVASAVSADGSVIVGWSDQGGPNGPGTGGARAVRWTSASGMQDLNNLLVNAGVNMAGIRLQFANGISGNGQFIVGQGIFPTGAAQAFVVRYYEVPQSPPNSGGQGSQNSSTGTGSSGPISPQSSSPEPIVIAGVTTQASVQSSMEALLAKRFNALSHQFSFADLLLGHGKPSRGNEAGVFAAWGSTTAGLFARYGERSGISLRGGIAYAKEDLSDIDFANSSQLAGAVRYVFGAGPVIWPFVEVGGWLAPNSAIDVTRNYINGSGVAVGSGKTTGDVSYAFASVGSVIDISPADELVASIEFGRARNSTKSYTERMSSTNPFEASFSDGTDVADVVRFSLGWSHRLTHSLDSTVWGLVGHALETRSNLIATVPGFGNLSPKLAGKLDWAEFGARLGYRISSDVTVDAFSTGITSELGDTRVHTGIGLRLRF